MPPLDPLRAGPETTASGLAARLDALGLPLTQLLVEALDQLDYGLLLTDVQGRLLCANRSARRQCADAGGPCQLQAERVAARLPAQQPALLRAIQQAGGQGRRSMVALGEAGSSTTVAVVPLAGGSAGGAGEPRAVLLVFGKQQVCETLSVDHYARVHGLTHAEGMVLSALCEGDKPTEVAQRFGVAVSTVRTQISAIRQKTQSASIRDLVRRIAVLPPIVSALGRGPAH